MLQKRRLRLLLVEWRAWAAARRVSALRERRAVAVHTKAAARAAWRSW